MAFRSPSNLGIFGFGLRYDSTMRRVSQRPGHHDAMDHAFVTATSVLHTAIGPDYEELIYGLGEI